MFVKGAGVICKEHALYWLILYYFSHFTVLAHAGFGFSGVCVYTCVCLCVGGERLILDSKTILSFFV